MTASDSLSNEDISQIAEIEGLRDVDMAADFGTEISITGFVWQITTTSTR